jgi:general secretion pathway protein G
MASVVRSEQVRRKKGERGLTLVELIVAFTIMALLTTMAVPLARYKVRRDRERVLLDSLREIRKAIDDYKDASLAGKIEVKLGTDGYPESLEQLVKGVKLLQSPDGKKIKFLRRIPLDPMTNSRDWGMRSEQDDPASQSWGRQNVFDVYSKSTERARDGTLYAEW